MIVVEGDVFQFDDAGPVFQVDGAAVILAVAVAEGHVLRSKTNVVRKIDRAAVAVVAAVLGSAVVKNAVFQIDLGHPFLGADRPAVIIRAAIVDRAAPDIQLGVTVQDKAAAAAVAVAVHDHAALEAFHAVGIRVAVRHGEAGAFVKIEKIAFAGIRIRRYDDDGGHGAALGFFRAPDAMAVQIERDVGKPVDRLAAVYVPIGAEGDLDVVLLPQNAFADPQSASVKQVVMPFFPFICFIVFNTADDVVIPIVKIAPFGLIFRIEVLSRAV